jgi:hypothetical protein
VTVNAGTGVIKSGYDTDVVGVGAAGPNDGNGIATTENYLATAVPQTVGTSGQRGFNTDAGGSIFVDPAGGPAGTLPLQ